MFNNLILAKVPKFKVREMLLKVIEIAIKIEANEFKIKKILIKISF